MSYISGENRNQSILFPESLEEYITPDNPVRIIDEQVTQLDSKALQFKRACDPRLGRPPYHPALLLKLYLYDSELDEIDEVEFHDHRPDAAEVQQRIKELKERKARYHNSVEVNYNVQTSVDARHKLIADFKVINKPNDLGQLAPMAMRTKKILGQPSFTVLADKGYYHAKDLAYCSRKGMTLYVTKQTYANGTKDKEFYPDKFCYEKENDCYPCPTGQRLYYYRSRKKDGKIIGKTYRNQDFLDAIDR